MLIKEILDLADNWLMLVRIELDILFKMKERFTYMKNY